MEMMMLIMMLMLMLIVMTTTADMMMVLQLPLKSRFVCRSPAVISTSCLHDHEAHASSLVAHLSSSSSGSTATNSLSRLHRCIGHHQSTGR
jgi:hypothetical protein